MITIDSTLTKNEQDFLRELLRSTPRPFLNSPDPEKVRNYKLLGVAAQALSDYNGMPPVEGYNFNGLPRYLYELIVFGTQLYLVTYKQMEFSLVDLQYSSQGLSITLDRVGKLNVPLDNFERMWLRRLQNRKNVVTLGNGGIGLETPRFNSSMSRVMVGLGQGGAFGWNVP